MYDTLSDLLQLAAYDSILWVSEAGHMVHIHAWVWSSGVNVSRSGVPILDEEDRCGPASNGTRCQGFANTVRMGKQ